MIKLHHIQKRALQSVAVGGSVALIWRTSNYVLSALVMISALAGLATFMLIPNMNQLFVDAGLSGKDLNKANQKDVIPEGLGVVAGAMYLISLLLFIPIVFANLQFQGISIKQSVETLYQLAKYLAAVLSIACMLFLGFADDVLNLRWRDKLFLPTISSLPILMVYYVTVGRTEVLMPLVLRNIFGRVVDLGALYYVYMGMLAVFCTNSINILAGINGVEAGQSLVIAISILINNVIQINGTCCVADHLFSLYLIFPFITVTSSLLYHNWYPARIFVGDTFCYFAGMTFATVGILGHFSKTMLLFFIPQVFNFVYSVPQLFHFVPCPRHRMPKLDESQGKLIASTCDITHIGKIGALFVSFFSSLGLVQVTYEKSTKKRKMNNLTLINLALIKFGPATEAQLTRRILGLQVICSFIAFFARYALSFVFY